MLRRSIVLRWLAALAALAILVVTASLCERLFWFQTGIASWYGPGFYNHKTASGELFLPGPYLTAAHKTLPFGTMVKVYNRDNGRSVIVRINDRGPYVRGRIIDLSRYAAEESGMINSGTAKVLLTRVR